MSLTNKTKHRLVYAQADGDRTLVTEGWWPFQTVRVVDRNVHASYHLDLGGGELTSRRGSIEFWAKELGVDKSDFIVG